MQPKLGSGPLIAGIVLGSLVLGTGFWSEIGIVTMIGMGLLALTTVLGLALPPENPARAGAKLPARSMPRISVEDLRGIAIPTGAFTTSSMILAVGLWREIGIVTIVGMLLISLSLILGLQGSHKASSNH